MIIGHENAFVRSRSLQHKLLWLLQLKVTILHLQLLSLLIIAAATASGLRHGCQVRVLARVVLTWPSLLLLVVVEIHVEADDFCVAFAQAHL